MAETTVSPNNASVTFKRKPMTKKSKSAEAAPSVAESDRDWEARSAFNTIKDAEKHQADPDMMKRVAKHAQTESDGLTAVMAKLQKQGLVSDNQAAKIARRRSAPRK